MNEEKAREIFEAWYANAYPNAHRLDTFMLTTPGGPNYYFAERTNAAWLAFRAGLRAGLAVETGGSFW